MNKKEKLTVRDFLRESHSPLESSYTWINVPAYEKFYVGGAVYTGAYQNYPLVVRSICVRLMGVALTNPLPPNGPLAEGLPGRLTVAFPGEDEEYCVGFGWGNFSPTSPLALAYVKVIEAKRKNKQSI